MDAAKIADSALLTIAKNGRTLPIVRPTSGFDQITGQPTAAGTTEGTITGVVLPRYKGQVFPAMDDALKSALVAGRMRTILAAAVDATFPPQPLDVISFDSRDWEIVGVTELSPDGTPIIYTIGVIQR